MLVFFLGLVHLPLSRSGLLWINLVLPFSSSLASWEFSGSWKEGRKDIPEQLVHVVPTVLVANWSLWIPAMSINFAVVPLKFQVLFGNVVALLWNTCLSYKSALSNENGRARSANRGDC